MGDADFDNLVNESLTDLALTDAEVAQAVRSAFTFLRACVDGQITEATVPDRIAAARSLLEHASRRPDLIADLVTGAGMLGDEDLAVIATVLD